jgi:hypothetical protein
MPTFSELFPDAEHIRKQYEPEFAHEIRDRTGYEGLLAAVVKSSYLFVILAASDGIMPARVEKLTVTGKILPLDQVKKLPFADAIIQTANEGYEVSQATILQVFPPGPAHPSYQAQGRLLGNNPAGAAPWTGPTTRSTY